METPRPATVLSDFATLALFGQDNTERLVAVEPNFESGVTRFFRDENDTVRRDNAPFQRWMLLDKKPEYDLPNAEYSELEGEGYRWLAEFPTQPDFMAARHIVREHHTGNLTYPGGAKAYFLRSGATLFKGMTFEQVSRFQFDIETVGLDPEVPENRILLIAVSDNRGFLELIEGDERQILERFATLIRERDPDVIEGHNMLGFDFPYVLKRAQRNGIRLIIGRDGSEPRIGEERNYAVTAGNSRPFRPIYLYGRHVLDTYLMVQRFDWAKQALTGYGLKECARVFGFADADRVELPRDKMTELYRDSPDLVRLYATQDVIETRKLAELITPVDFYQSQMVPDNYGSVAVTGNGEKINSLFIRACLLQGYSVPHIQAARPYAGGYSEVRVQGLLHEIVKADVESLYPSLMLTHKIAPATDTTGVFLPCLRELTNRRLEAKRKLQEPDSDEHYWDGLQGSYKVLINSFYGYLGGPFNFNDYDAAGQVTEAGRELVQKIASEIEATQGKVIEIDTDGVYFVAPTDVREKHDEAAEREYVARVGAFLPGGIRLAFDGRFKAMLSIKTKNYVLETYDGRKIFKGASLRSRSDERYGRKFLSFAVEQLFAGDLEAIGAHYGELIEEILAHKIPVEDLARRERITDNTFSSDNRARMAKAAKGAIVGEFVRLYERNDGSLARIEEYDQDEHTRHYMDKLYKFAKRIEEAMDAIEKGAFGHLIQKPTSQGLPQNLQTSMDLFG